MALGLARDRAVDVIWTWAALEDMPSAQPEPAVAPESQEPAQTAPSASQDSESVSGVASDVASPSEPADAPAENLPAAAREGAASDDPESVSVPIGPTTTEQDNSQSAAPNGKAVDGVDVEALQKRLKLVEQRFTGAYEDYLCPTVPSFVLLSSVFRLGSWLPIASYVISPLWRASQRLIPCGTSCGT